MLEFQDQVALVSNVAIRSEMHGEGPVSACYIDLQMELGAEVLDHFAKGLRSALYASPRPNQKPLEGVEEATGPKLKFDGVMHPLKLKLECAGYNAQIVWGDLAGSVNVKLADAKLKKFRAEPKSGGSCALSFQVQAHPSKEAYGELAMLQRREVKVTLEAPKAGETPAAKTEGTEPGK